jgi:hypothetical protein
MGCLRIFESGFTGEDLGKQGEVLVTAQSESLPRPLNHIHQLSLFTTKIAGPDTPTFQVALSKANTLHQSL